MDYKLKVFKEVALTKSFTKAAQNLNLSQPAVSKTIKSLEAEYGKAFFDRKGNTISLTAAGLAFLNYTEKILQLYQQAYEEFLDEEVIFPTTLKIGASTSVANYVLPPLLAALEQKEPKLQIHLMIGNTDKIQDQLLNKELDMGIVEGNKHHPRLTYQKFIKDELVLVTGDRNLPKIPNPITAEQLQHLPFIEREYGSGTREVITDAFRKQAVTPPESSIILSSTESIKSYLQHSDSYAFLSIHTVRNELLDQRLQLIELEDFSIYRWFYFITRPGYPTKMTDKIFHYLKRAYNQK